MKENKWYLYLIIFCLVVLSVFPADIILPAIPNISEDLSQDLQVGLMGTSGYLVVLGVSTVITGVFADRYGVKTVFSACLSLSALGSLICFSSQHMSWFISGRVLEAMGASSLSLIHSLIRQGFQGRNANSLRVFLAVTSGLFISSAPLMGALIVDALSWRFLFFAFFILSVLTLLLVNGYFAAQTTPKKVMSMPFKPLLVRYWVNNLIGLAAFLIHFSFILISVHVFMIHYQLDGLTYGFWMLLYGGGFVFSGVVYSKKIKDFSFERQIWLGIFFIGLSCLFLSVLPIDTSPLSFILSVGVASVGVAFIQPAAMTAAMDSIPSSKSGLYSSLLAIIRFAVGGLILTILSMDVESFFQSLSIVYGFLGLILIFLMSCYRFFAKSY